MLHQLDHGVLSRKKPLLLVGDKMTSSCKLVRLSAGLFVRSAQFAVVKSEFCCNKKLVEGTIHDSLRSPFPGAIFI